MKPFYRHFANSILLPAVGAYYASPVKKQINFLKKSQWWSQDNLERYQKIKFKKLLKNAYDNVPYYHNILKEKKLYPSDFKEIKDLEKLPIMNKQTVRDNFNQLINKSYAQRAFQNRTGGTTGKPLRYLVTNRSNAQSFANKIRAFSWGGMEYGDKFATLGGSSIIPGNNSFKSQARPLFERNLALSAVHMSRENLKSYTKKLQSFKPDFLRGYPTAIYTMAKYISEEAVEPIKFKSVFTTAEVLQPSHRQAIEDVFDCEVFNHYGCKDGGASANECSEHSGLHINSERCILEVISEKDDLSNNEGKLIWTDLENYAMPFIRYFPDDLGVLSNDKCNCGRHHPSLKSITGRTTDVIKFSSGTSISGPAMTLIFKDYNISEYQLLYKKVDQLDVNLVKSTSYKRGEGSKLKQLLQHHCGEEVEVVINFVDTIERASSSKFKFIVNNLNNDA